MMPKKVRAATFPPFTDCHFHILVDVICSRRESICAISHAYISILCLYLCMYLRTFRFMCRCRKCFMYLSPDMVSSGRWASLAPSVLSVCCACNSCVYTIEGGADGCPAAWAEHASFASQFCLQVHRLPQGLG